MQHSPNFPELANAKVMLLRLWCWLSMFLSFAGQKAVPILFMFFVGSKLLAAEQHLTTDATKTAKELAIKRVDVHPNIAWALRSGLVGPSEYLSGLSPRWKPEQKWLAVDMPGPVVEAKVTNSLQDFIHDEEQERRLDQAVKKLDDSLRLSRRELEQVQYQLSLLQLIGDDVSEEFSAVHAAALSQLLDFVSTQDRALLAEEHRLRGDIEALSAQRNALLRQRNKRPEGETLLHLPGAAGSHVQLFQEIPQLRWAPSYRIEVVPQGQVVLHRDVKVLSNLTEALAIPELHFHALPKVTVTQPKPLSFKRLGVSDKAPENAAEAPKRLRALGQYGGSRQSESAVEVSLSYLLRLQNADGSWGQGDHRIAVTCLAMLAKLGGGYDHRTPNRYRRVVQRGLAFLNDNAAVADGIQNHALLLTVYAELYAMTQDSELRPHVEAAYERLRHAIVVDKALEDSLANNALLSGPVSVGLVSMALKSLKASGITKDLSSINRHVKMSAELLLTHEDQDAAMVAIEILRTFLQVTVKEYADPYAHEAAMVAWIQKAPQWIQGGQAELVWLATLVTFQHGGNVWSEWNKSIRDYLIALSTDDPQEITTLIPHHLGPAAAWSLKTLAGSVYYRYVPVGAKGGRAGTKTKPILTLPNPQKMAKGWPLVMQLSDVILPEGEGIRRFAVDQIMLEGKVSHIAIPGRASGVWRVLHTANSLPVPLAAGPVDVIVNGRAIGNGELDFVAPREKFRLDLGLDNRFFVERRESFEEREVAGRRVRTVTVECSLHGPDGVTVSLEEAMPKPVDPEVRLRSLQPALSEDDLDRALRDDPQWRFTLTPKNGQAVMKIIYELRYPSQATIKKGGN